MIFIIFLINLNSYIGLKTRFLPSIFEVNINRIMADMTKPTDKAIPAPKPSSSFNRI